jgi:hypothetical protein
MALSHQLPTRSEALQECSEVKYIIQGNLIK